MFTRPMAVVLTSLCLFALPSLALAQVPPTDMSAETESVTPAVSPAEAGLAIGVVIALVIGGILLNFLPVVIAAMRGHRSTFAIFLLVLFLGWSGIGWLIALIWSFADTGRRD